jgi:hypothetical protein
VAKAGEVGVADGSGVGPEGLPDGAGRPRCLPRGAGVGLGVGVGVGMSIGPGVGASGA